MKCKDKSCSEAQELYVCKHHQYICCKQHMADHSLTNGLHKYEIANSFTRTKLDFLEELSKKRENVLSILNNIKESYRNYLNKLETSYNNSVWNLNILKSNIGNIYQEALNCNEYTASKLSDIFTGSNTKINAQLNEIKIPSVICPEQYSDLKLFELVIEGIESSHPSDIEIPHLSDSDISSFNIKSTIHEFTDTGTYIYYVHHAEYQGQEMCLHQFYHKDQNEITRFEDFIKFVKNHKDDSMFLRYSIEYSSNGYSCFGHEEIKEILEIDLTKRRFNQSYYSLKEQLKYFKNLCDSLTIIAREKFILLSPRYIYITPADTLKIGWAFTKCNMKNEYAPPEIARNHGKYRESASIVYSLGLIMLEIITLHDTKDLGIDVSGVQIPQLLDMVNAELKQILEGMLIVDYHQRTKLSVVKERLNQLEGFS